MKEFLISLMVIFILVGIAYAGGEDFLSAIQAMQAMRDVSKSEAIMLNPEAKAKLKTVYVEVSNTSSVNIEINRIKDAVTKSLTEKGYQIVDAADNAGYIVQIDLSKLNIIKEKKSNFFGSLLGGIARTTIGIAGAAVGALSGAGVTGTQIISQAGASVGEAVGSAVGSGIDDALSGENYSYLGSVVIQIKERYTEVKEYRGQYPLAGNSKEIEGTFTDEIANKITKVVQNIF
ncbi:MAG: complement resistance protein TraT [Candidatus Micrarchaeia archaeon]